MLKVGQLIRSPHFPESVEIKKVEEYAGQYIMIAAVERSSNNYYEIMLTREEMNELCNLSQKTYDGKKISIEDLHHFLQYYAFFTEKHYSNKRSLGNPSLIPLPHQIDAVYSRMLQAPKVRFLLADDPGAGKTIMTGMLIKELKARGSIERILILVPPLVLKQWQDELNEKFKESFMIVNREMLYQYGGKNPFVEHDLCLVSMYWAAREEIKNLISESGFDLVVVDEAHKMAAYTHGIIKRKVAKTKLYQLGELVLRQANHCLLLTATPHKGDAENFRHLMRLVDEDVFSMVPPGISLKERANPFIIRRLKENLKNFDGSPLFPKRTVKTIRYQLSDVELSLYESFTQYVIHHFNRAMQSGSNSTAFAMMLLQRRLSSSIAAIDLSLRRRKKRLESLLELSEEDRKKVQKKFVQFVEDDWEVESLLEQERVDNRLIQAFDLIDQEELMIEINELKRLIEKTSQFKSEYG